MNELLEIVGLDVSFPSQRGTTYAVRDVSINVKPGEVLGVVGESGAGKSTIGNAVINLLEPPGKITNGKVLFQGENISSLDDKEMRNIRGQKIGMIFQDPLTSLNPLMTIGAQLLETITKTTKLVGDAVFKKAIELLEAVGIEQPEVRFFAYPHEFSGGMRQRVVIALALAGDPDLVIADEPTTALDVSIQEQILELIRVLCRERKLGVIIITHDIGVIANIADRVAVMYDGSVVETGKVHQILTAPKHQYTKSLIAAVPRGDIKFKRFKSVDYIEGGKQSYKSIDVDQHWLGEKVRKNSTDKAIFIEGLNKEFVIKKAVFERNRVYLKAVKDVSFSVEEGESFGLVGESGSGKSTIARLIVGLSKVDRGSIKIFGQDVANKRKDQKVIAAQGDVQMIFQDPYSSLNARMRVQDIIAEPIRYYQTASSDSEALQIVGDLLDHVGLGSTAMLKYPHEFSGGQRQRISIARALASRPKILICDEPTSALDVSVQAHILNLLKDLQDELRLTMLFISHDLPVIRQMCDRVAVMRHGAICEIATTDNLFDAPNHEYSKHLLNLIPRMESVGKKELIS
jgi:peptide/nickel transport system ATP-binding protein|tara:strand:+ start:3663 stop:5381 length:1719 start_codon:yes stop_codon:yes gene_type:complete